MSDIEVGLCNICGEQLGEVNMGIEDLTNKAKEVYLIRSK